MTKWNITGSPVVILNLVQDLTKQKKTPLITPSPLGGCVAMERKKGLNKS
jgi:hypothetical protein